MSTELASDTEIQNALNGEAGYWIGPLWSSAEVQDIKALIFRLFLGRIAEMAPDTIDVFRETGLENYHHESHRIDHANAWTHHARLMSPDGIDYVQRSSLLRRLADEFGSAEITNEGEGHDPEIIWRIARPNANNDVAPLHANIWYWALNDLPVPSKRRIIKVWTLISGETGKGGLRAVPGSHLTGPWSYDIVQAHDFVKPVFNEPASGFKPTLLPTSPGESVVFSYDLLHGGAMTTGQTCRVSIEFSVSVPAP